MLDPDQRSLYTAALTPPPGMVLDAALATTYSLDPTTLLSVPLHLALLGGPGRATPDNPILLLEALRRVSERICVFAQQGRVQTPSGPPNALYGLLESMLVECRAPFVGGAFHPKLWLLRFVEPGDAAESSTGAKRSSLLRLVVLSRNLTTDRSWDLSLTLDGHPGGRGLAANQPLSDLLDALPGMAVSDLSPARAVLIKRLASEARRAEWTRPEGFDSMNFHVLGLRPGPWTPPASDRMAVISPFLSREALAHLRQTTDALDVVISRSEALDSLGASALEGVDQVLVLADAAETEDGEEPAADERLGLHAKALILKRGWNTHLFVGSANATTAALVVGHNLEILVELVGRRSKVRGVENLTAPDGLGAYLTAYQPPGEPMTVDPQAQWAEQALERARGVLEQGRLRLVCASEGDGWRLQLTAADALVLEPAVRVAVWPISVRQELARDAAGLNAGSAVDLGIYPCAHLTGLIAFELAVEQPKLAMRFVLNLPLDGLPVERDVAILRLVLNNRDGFLRYLLLLLGEEAAGDAFAAPPGSGNRLWGHWGDGGLEALPLFEELTRAFSRGPERLAEVRRVIDKLRSADGSQQPGEETIPADFLALWAVFDQALAGQGKA